MSLNQTSITCLEKAAIDNGFDLDFGQDGEWLVFGSSHAALKIWLTVLAESQFLLAFSRYDVFEAISPQGVEFSTLLPKDAVAAHSTRDLTSLYRLVRRAFQLARALPDEPLRVFLDKTASLPRTTEAERLVVQRIGQGIFRDRLLDYWEGRCAITGLAVPELLRASHIKPWADCTTDAERLDVFNGILLAPHLDAAFDRGFISLADDGIVIVSTNLADKDRKVLGLDQPMRAPILVEGHHQYLLWHRQKVFR